MLAPAVHRAKRVAPSKHWIAAPMAVSSCRTFVEALSLGSTVLEFLNSRAPDLNEEKL